jgi:hypothetical protein
MFIKVKPGRATELMDRLADSKVLAMGGVRYFISKSIPLYARGKKGSGQARSSGHSVPSRGQQRPSVAAQRPPGAPAPAAAAAAPAAAAAAERSVPKSAETEQRERQAQGREASAQQDASVETAKDLAKKMGKAAKRTTESNKRLNMTEQALASSKIEMAQARLEMQQTKRDVELLTQKMEKMEAELAEFKRMAGQHEKTPVSPLGETADEKKGEMKSPEKPKEQQWREEQTPARHEPDEGKVRTPSSAEPAKSNRYGGHCGEGGEGRRGAKAGASASQDGPVASAVDRISHHDEIGKEWGSVDREPGFGGGRSGQVRRRPLVASGHGDYGRARTGDGRPGARRIDVACLAGRADHCGV